MAVGEIRIPVEVSDTEAGLRLRATLVVPISLFGEGDTGNRVETADGLAAMAWFQWDEAKVELGRERAEEPPRAWPDDEIGIPV